MDREALLARTAASPGVAIAIRDLEKNYGAVQAVRGISLEVQRGEIFGLIGADGAGKTTTFQILAGVMEATKGTTEIFESLRATRVREQDISPNHSASIRI